MSKKQTKSCKAGTQIADGIISMLHLMYNLETSTRVLNAIIYKLESSRKQFERGANE